MQRNRYHLPFVKFSFQGLENQASKSWYVSQLVVTCTPLFSAARSSLRVFFASFYNQIL